jgi:hypothetical protein
MLESQELILEINESAFLVLSKCDGTATVRELCQALATQFDLSFSRAQDDLLGFLNCLYELDVMSYSVTYRLDDQYAERATGKSTWTMTSG